MTAEITASRIIVDPIDGIEYKDKMYFIVPRDVVDRLVSLDRSIFSQTSKDTIRWSLDGSLALLSTLYSVRTPPAIMDRLRAYTHKEIIAVMHSREWTEEESIG